MKITCITLCAALFGGVSLANADQTFEYPADKPFFEISFPDKWKVDGDEESLSAAPKDDAVAVELIALDASELEDAIDEAEAALTEEFGDLDVDDPQEGEINGMDVLLVNAKGAIDGTTININLCVFVPVKADTCFMLFFFAPPEELESHGEALNGILQSIKSR